VGGAKLEAAARAAVAALLALQALAALAAGAAGFFREDVSVDYQFVTDLSGSGLSYQYATASYSESYGCPLSTAYPGCVTYSVSLLESSGALVELDLYFTASGDLAGISVSAGGSTLTVAASPPIPTSLASIASGGGEASVTFYTYQDGSLTDTRTLDVRVDVEGPSKESVEWLWPSGSATAELEAYTITIYEMIGGEWSKDIVLKYAPAAGALLYIYISDTVELAQPSITADTPPPSPAGGGAPTETAPGAATSASPTGAGQATKPQASGGGQSQQSPPASGQSASVETTSGGGGVEAAIGGLAVLLAAAGAGYYVASRRRPRGSQQAPQPSGGQPPPPGPPAVGGGPPPGPPPGAGGARLEIEGATFQAAPAAVVQVPVRASCPRGCRVRLALPEGLNAVVEPPEASVVGESTVTFTLRLGSGVAPGSYTLAALSEPPAEAPAAASLVVVEPSTPAPEGLVPGYRILGRIGSGGFSTVYLAERLSDGLRVALKVPRIELGETVGAQLAETFRREAETWSKLKHPNIVEVLDYDVKPIPYIAVEYMPGGSLRSRLEPGKPLPLGEALNVAVSVGEALSYAHHLGVIHRDIKPENVLLAGDGTPKLTDFGLAKVLLQASMSSAGGFKGTLLYAAPEQVDPQTYGGPDWRTDIWQYGAMLYELLTGRPPFQAENPLQLVREITASEPPRPSQLNPQVPGWLDEIVMRCLEKRKEDRWRSIDVVLEKIRENMGG